MNQLPTSSLNIARYVYSRRKPGLYNKQLDNCKLVFDYQAQNVGDCIKNLLSKDQPCMIGRLGSTELMTLLTYLNIINKSSLLEKSINYMKGDFGWFWWDSLVKKQMKNLSGFFPTDETYLNKFGELMINDIRSIDILGSWIETEQELCQFLPDAVRVPLIDLEPYCHDNPWSEVLKGKIVLVIHPFEESILTQYEKRSSLFLNNRVLTSFELKTIKAVQSLAGNPVNFNNWFDGLNFMFDQIYNSYFDIAIIGAGAYGLPLAAFVKRIGKKAIHLGGATQILFGIRGARWDERPFYQNLFNEHWVRPLTSEKPQTVDSFVQLHKVENGCYW